MHWSAEYMLVPMIEQAIWHLKRGDIPPCHCDILHKDYPNEKCINCLVREGAELPESPFDVSTLESPCPTCHGYGVWLWKHEDGIVRIYLCTTCNGDREAPQVAP